MVSDREVRRYIIIVCRRKDMDVISTKEHFEGR